MITVRKSAERGHANHGWLDSYHTFSFADYHNPSFMGYRDLRVINEDRIEGGKGFPRHGHRDMEIITVLLEGELKHQDTLGNSSIIRPGEVQRMTAGTGIEHSEYNHDPQNPCHLLQIWILPERSRLQPGYEQKDFRQRLEADGLVLVASPDGSDDSVSIHQDVKLHYGRAIKQDLHASVELKPGRGGWLQVARGQLTMNGHALSAGDGAACETETVLRIEASKGSEFLVFDLN